MNIIELLIFVLILTFGFFFTEMMNNYFKLHVYCKFVSVFLGMGIYTGVLFIVVMVYQYLISIFKGTKSRDTYEKHNNRGDEDRNK